MFTLFNWLTSLPPRSCWTLFIVSAIACLLLPWGVARWRDRHGAPPRKRRRSLLAALLTVVHVFSIACLSIGFVLVLLIRAWLHFDDSHHRTTNMAAGLLLGLLIPLSFLASALVYQAIRWKRCEAVENPAPPVERAVPANEHGAKSGVRRR